MYPTLADDSLTHQVRFVLRKHKTHVTCVCRSRAPRSPNSTDGSRSLVTMGPAPDQATARRLYNDPANHYAPFTDEDRAKW